MDSSSHSLGESYLAGCFGAPAGWKHLLLLRLEPKQVGDNQLLLAIISSKVNGPLVGGASSSPCSEIIRSFSTGS